VPGTDVVRNIRAGCPLISILGKTTGMIVESSAEAFRTKAAEASRLRNKICIIFIASYKQWLTIVREMGKTQRLSMMLSALGRKSTILSDGFAVGPVLQAIGCVKFTHLDGQPDFGGVFAQSNIHDLYPP
jgi:hypothetical protein